MKHAFVDRSTEEKLLHEAKQSLPSDPDETPSKIGVWQLIVVWDKHG